MREALLRGSRRQRIMVALGAKCGLRRAEIARAHTRDLDPDTDELLVTGKGGRQRWVPLPPDLAQVIRESPRGWLFPNPHHPEQHLTADRVGRLITMALPDNVTPHQLRHFAASEWHDTGEVTMFELRDLLGHATVVTTQRYVRVRNRAAAAAVRRCGGRLPRAS